MMQRSLYRAQIWKDSSALKVFEQKGMVVYRDQPGRLEKTSIVLGWMKNDRASEGNSQQRRRVGSLVKRVK